MCRWISNDGEIEEERYRALLGGLHVVDRFYLYSCIKKQCTASENMSLLVFAVTPNSQNCFKENKFAS
jgi:hypothetical protein